MIIMLITIFLILVFYSMSAVFKTFSCTRLAKYVHSSEIFSQYNVTCHVEYSCFFLSPQIFSYGKNTSGELGRSCSDDRASPIRAIESNLKGKIVTKVSCGVDFSVAVLDNGKVFSHYLLI